MMKITPTIEWDNWFVEYTYDNQSVATRFVNEDFARMLLRAKQAGREELQKELRDLLGS
jgi:hypothetical protein